jgi:hypothetical protein
MRKTRGDRMRVRTRNINRIETFSQSEKPHKESFQGRCSYVVLEKQCASMASSMNPIPQATWKLENWTHSINVFNSASDKANEGSTGKHS